MSTILRALKRAEQDSPKQGDEPGGSVTLNVLKTLDSKKHRQGPLTRLKPWAAGLIIVMAAAVVLYFLLFFNKPFQTGSSPDILAPLTVSKTPAGKEEQKTIGHSVIQDDPLPGAVQKRDAAQTILKSPPPVKAQVSDSPKPAIKKDIPVKKSKLPLKADQKKGRTDENPEPVVKKTDIRHMEDGILKIQAISWAQDPMKRLAVINNEVVRQGESLKGYRIIQIKKDGVILRRADQDYKLKFRYR